MMYANYHTHTHYCHHAKGEIREYVEHAIGSGIKILGFADHVPYPFPGGYETSYRISRSDLEAYGRDVLALQKEYEKDIEIHLGFEAEYYPLYFQDLLDSLRDFPYEYMIMGQHWVGNEIDEGAQYTNAWPPDMNRLNRYVDQVLEGLGTGKFTYLAHPDLCRFNGEGECFNDAARRLCLGCKECGVPLELNMQGTKGDGSYPLLQFWQIAAEVGNDCIIGVDAHLPDQMGEEDLYLKMTDMTNRLGLHILQTVPLINPKA